MKQQRRVSAEWIVLAAAFAIQMGALVAANLFFLRAGADFDGNTFFSAAIEVWRQKSLILDDFYYSTSLMIDSPMPLAALFFGIFGNIFFAYGLANVLILAADLLLIWQLTRMAGYGLPGFFAASCLLLSPYSAGQVGQMEMTVWGSAGYSVRLLFLLLVVVTICRTEADMPRRALWWSLSAAAALVTAFSSSAYFWQAAVLPLLCAQVVLLLWKNDVRWMADRTAVFLYLLTAATAGGMLLSKLVESQPSGDFIGQMSLADAQGLTDNLGLLLVAVLRFWGWDGAATAFAEDPAQLARLVRLAAIVCTAAGALLWVWFNRRKSQARRFALWAGMLAAVGCAIQLLLTRTYSGVEIQGRYLLLPFALLPLLAGWMLESLPGAGKRLLCGLLSLGIFALVLGNTYTVLYSAAGNDLSWQEDVLSAVQQEGGGVLLDYCDDGVYQTGRSAYVLTGGEVLGMDCSLEQQPRRYGNPAPELALQWEGKALALFEAGDPNPLQGRLVWLQTINGRNLYEVPEKLLPSLLEEREEGEATVDLEIKD